MAIVNPNLDLQASIGVKGIIDTYQVGNRWYCRKWPRKPMQPNSPAQLAQRQRMKDMLAARQALPQWYVDIYRRVSCPHGYSYDDLLRSSLYTLTWIPETIEEQKNRIMRYWSEPLLPVVTNLTQWDGVPLITLFKQKDLDYMIAYEAKPAWFHAAGKWRFASMYRTCQSYHGLQYSIIGYDCYKGKKSKPVYMPVDRWQHYTWEMWIDCCPEDIEYRRIYALVLGYGSPTLGTVSWIGYTERPPFYKPKYAIILPPTIINAEKWHWLQSHVYPPSKPMDTFTPAGKIAPRLLYD